MSSSRAVSQRRPNRGEPRLSGLFGPPPAKLADRKAAGKALRERVSRKLQGDWTLDRRRPRFVAQLKASVAGRRRELLPIRWRRMAASPFGWFRGSAALMAADIGPMATCGLGVQACGDAHLLNLGAYAAPDGHLVFDLDDFDETCRGPFEWDLKRLSASFLVAGRSVGHKDRASLEAVRWMVQAYRESLDLFAEMRILELARFEIGPRLTDKPLWSIFEAAARNTPRQLLKKVTRPDAHGFAKFQSQPPLLVSLEAAEAGAVLGSLAGYRATLSPGRQEVLDAYVPWDAAFKVVGTGSVGVDDYVVLLYGNGAGDPLFLQLKEQDASCWKPYLGVEPAYASRYPHQGRRAAEGQHRTQTVADPFLGWTRASDKDFLVRRWSDHKASLDISLLQERAVPDYAILCGQVLAKAHARTGDAGMLAGYCGEADRLDVAMARFARSYGDQVEADHARFRRALKQGALGT